jgi:hypothetical protein
MRRDWDVRKKRERGEESRKRMRREGTPKGKSQLLMMKE